MLRPHVPDQIQLRLEIHVMRQLQMLDEPRRLHIVRVRNDKFLVLRRRDDILAEFLRPQRAIDHVLVTPALLIATMQAMPAAHSDHLALSVELDVPEHALG